MEAFLSRKRQKTGDIGSGTSQTSISSKDKIVKDKSGMEMGDGTMWKRADHDGDELSTMKTGTVEMPEEQDSTDFKLALLASLHPDCQQELLLDLLLAHNGSVEVASAALTGAALPEQDSPRKRRLNTVGYQSSMAKFASSSSTADRNKSSGESLARNMTMTKRGKTLHLFSPADIEKHTPCSIIHNFLSPEDAEALLRELLRETPHFTNDKFQMFDRTVESPHTYRFYVDSYDEVETQKTDYFYNGGKVNNVTQSKPEMLRISRLVRDKVNVEIERRIRDFYPDRQKLKFQSREEWKPNASFVNCYDGARESVGYHSDQLTYLGPRAVIGSLSLGVAREFRVRRIVPPAESGRETSSASPSSPFFSSTINPTSTSMTTADAQGQIAIHLPHNSLLVMHAEMQEEWKHAVAPAQTIDPHPVAGNKRLNITYRFYRDYLHPKFTPRCRCGYPAVLKCVQRRAATRGRYMWQCDRGFAPGEKACGFFVWAEFDVDGRPPWVKGYLGNANLPSGVTGQPEH